MAVKQQDPLGDTSPTSPNPGSASANGGAGGSGGYGGGGAGAAPGGTDVTVPPAEQGGDQPLPPAGGQGQPEPQPDVPAPPPLPSIVAPPNTPTSLGTFALPGLCNEPWSRQGHRWGHGAQEALQRRRPGSGANWSPDCVGAQTGRLGR